MTGNTEYPGAGMAIILPVFAGLRARKSVLARVPVTAMAAIILVLIAGCTSQPVTEPEPRVVRVEVPVPVPCQVKAPAVPAWSAEGLRKGDSLEVKVRALLAERRQRIGYERLLVAAVQSCQ